jgi:hypothetical protein
MDNREFGDLKANTRTEFLRRSVSTINDIDSGESFNIIIHYWNAIPVKNGLRPIRPNEFYTSVIPRFSSQTNDFVPIQERI